MARKKATNKRPARNGANPKKENAGVPKSGKAAKSSSESKSKPADDNVSKVSNGAQKNTAGEAESVPKNWPELDRPSVEFAQRCFVIGSANIPQLIVTLQAQDELLLNKVLRCFLAPMLPVKHHSWIIDKASKSEKSLMIANLISNFFQGYQQGFDDSSQKKPSFIEMCIQQSNPQRPPMQRPPGR